ncbi:MAG: hypothetical protein ACRC5T_08585, partial [Cetobacterium sp.]
EDYIECLMTLVKERGVKKVLFTIYDGYNNNIGVRHVKTHTGSFQANEGVGSKYYEKLLSPYGFEFVRKEGGYWKWEK